MINLLACWVLFWLELAIPNGLYPASFWSAPEVLKPQHVSAQNMDKSTSIKLLNLGSAAAPFLSLLLVFLLDSVSEWLLAFACQVRERLQLSKRKQRLPMFEKKGLTEGIKALGQLIWDVLSPAAISRPRPESRNGITDKHTQTWAQETCDLQRSLSSLTLARSFLHIML